MLSLSQNVKEQEKGCTKYLLFEQRSTDADRPDVILIEEWASQEALDRHGEQSYLKETHQALEREDLVIRDQEVKFMDEVWGFSGR